MGGRLGGDTDAPRPGAAHKLEAAARREMGDVDPAPRHFRQNEVPRHQDLLGSGRKPFQPQNRRVVPLVHHASLGKASILAVVDHRDIENLGVFEGHPHQVRRGDGVPVIGDGNDAALHHVSYLGELLAFPLLADAADGEDVDHRSLSRLGDDVLRHALAVVPGVGVGHHGDGGEPAGSRGRAACFHGFFVFPARLPQVDMHVDEPWGHDLAREIQDRDVVHGDSGRDTGDLPVANQDIPDAIQIAGGVHDASPSKQPVHRRLLPRASRAPPSGPPHRW